MLYENEFAVKQILCYRRERQPVRRTFTPCAEARDSESRLRVCPHLQNRVQRGATYPTAMYQWPSYLSMGLKRLPTFLNMLRTFCFGI